MSHVIGPRPRPLGDSRSKSRDPVCNLYLGNRSAAGRANYLLAKPSKMSMMSWKGEGERLSASCR